jgi:hypothetical protein
MSQTCQETTPRQHAPVCHHVLACHAGPMGRASQEIPPMLSLESAGYLPQPPAVSKVIGSQSMKRENSDLVVSTSESMVLSCCRARCRHLHSPGRIDHSEHSQSVQQCCRHNAVLLQQPRLQASRSQSDGSFRPPHRASVFAGVSPGALQPWCCSEHGAQQGCPARGRPYCSGTALLRLRSRQQQNI